MKRAGTEPGFRWERLAVDARPTGAMVGALYGVIAVAMLIGVHVLRLRGSPVGASEMLLLAAARMVLL